MPSLKVEIVMCNVKKIDTKAYGIEKPDCTCTVGIEGTEQSFTTRTERGLDPQWEQTATFEVANPSKDRLWGKFFMNNNTLQIGDQQFFNLDKVRSRGERQLVSRRRGSRVGEQRARSAVRSRVAIVPRAAARHAREAQGFCAARGASACCGDSRSSAGRASASVLTRPRPNSCSAAPRVPRTATPQLVTGKPTFKGIIVPGGKVDLMVTAVDFGTEDKETTLDDMNFMNLSDGEEGGMMMSDSDEEEEEEAAPEEAAAPAAATDDASTVKLPEGAEDLSGDKPYKLQVELAMCNVKKIDTKAYGIEKPDCTATVTIGDQSFTTRTERGLDPQWDQTVILGVTDPSKDRLSGKFFMNQGTKQIGDEQFFNLDKLVNGKSTFKGIIVPGGKVDMFVTALGWGAEEKEENLEDMGFMNTLDGDDEGGMMMSDSEEDED